MDQRIGWTAYSPSTPIQHMCIDHGRSDVSVPQGTGNRDRLLFVSHCVNQTREATARVCQGTSLTLPKERGPTEVQPRRKAEIISGWNGELGNFLTLPALPRRDAAFHQGRATKGPHWGMGGVSTAGLFAMTGPAASRSWNGGRHRRCRSQSHLFYGLFC